MGPRPVDFDEDLVRQSPTYLRWQKLGIGQKLRYACRDFTRGHGDDEERLMRRIMIARRNNLRDHDVLKRARAHTPGDKQPKVEIVEEEVAPPPKKKRGSNYVMTDDEVTREMDVPAVEGTRSYKAWIDLEDGQTFTYNQTYTKGKEGHEWLLKKNIWRRMRYRRENKRMVEKLKGTDPEPEDKNENEDESDDEDNAPDSTYSSAAAATAASVATHIVDHALPTNLLAGTDVSALSDDDNLHDDVVESAIAAAESYVKRAQESNTAELGATQAALDQSAGVDGSHPALSVHNPIMSAPDTGIDSDSSLGDDMEDHHHTPNPLVGFDGDALDVAAKLAAAASAAVDEDEDEDEDMSDDDYTAV